VVEAKILQVLLNNEADTTL